MKQKNEKRKVVMPLWVNLFFTTVSLLYLKFLYKIKIDRSNLKNQKRGCLLLYNHYSNKDHYVIKASTGYRRVTYVLASTFYLNKVLNVLLHLARAISKDQFKPDISAIRNMRQAIEKNQVIAISPAGQTTIDGNTAFISKTIVKFIRMAKADVMALQTRGVYLTFPKWRQEKRKCRMETKFIPLIKKEEIDNLTDDEIYNLVVNALSVREYEDQYTMKRKIKSKNIISGLQNIIVKCPKCGKYHSFNLVDKHIECDSCGLQIHMDEYGFLSYSDKSINFKTIPELYSYQREQVGLDFLNGMEYSDEVTVLSNINNKSTFEDLGRGIVTLKKEGLYLRSMLTGKLEEKFYSIENITQLPFHPGERFEIPNEECSLRLLPNEAKHLMDYVLVVDYLNYKKVGGYESNTKE